MNFVTLLQGALIGLTCVTVPFLFLCWLFRIDTITWYSSISMFLNITSGYRRIVHMREIWYLQASPSKKFWLMGESGYKTSDIQRQSLILKPLPKPYKYFFSLYVSNDHKNRNNHACKRILVCNYNNTGICWQYQRCSTGLDKPRSCYNQTKLWIHNIWKYLLCSLRKRKMTTL